MLRAKPDEEQKSPVRGGVTAGPAIRIGIRLLRLRSCRPKPSLWFDNAGAYAAIVAQREDVLCLENQFSQRSCVLHTGPEVRSSAAFLMTTPGTPQLLMGQEIAEVEPVSPDARRTIRWEDGNPNYLDIYTRLTKLRESSATLRRG
ncbi:MAG: hypothetical protein GF330_03160, partial [Candidatus Eisenbacteria bacterium]|nr:hypothetical protein [Candidatus Eisenbacteria bacterium]